MGLKHVSNIVNSQLIKAELEKYHNKDLDDFWCTATDVVNTCAALVKTPGFGSTDEA